MEFCASARNVLDVAIEQLSVCNFVPPIEP